MSLQGKAIIVTGAASGIGLSTVKLLLEQRAIVHALDLALDIPPPENAIDSFLAYPNVDVTNREQVRAAFESIVERSDNIHGLVHCAGILRAGNASAEEDEAFMKVLITNTGGTLITNSEFYRSVERFRQAFVANPTKESLSIVNIGSMASLRGIPGMPAYVASKHAVLGLSRTFAQDWGREGLRVNVVAPGHVDTPMTSGQPDNTSNAYVGALKSSAAPAEIASIIVFLLGDASSNVSGAIIEANGGWP